MNMQVSTPVDETLRHAYTRLAAGYDAQRGLFDMSAVLEDFFERLPATPGRLLDLGCGAGEPVASSFLERRWQVTGVDFCPAMLELAARHVPGMERHQADMRTLEMPPSSVDAITAIYSLFHVPAADHPGIFERFRLWLRPGGHALFTYATRHYTGADVFDGHIEFMGQSLFYSHMEPEQLRRVLVQTGLDVTGWQYRDIGGETFLWVTVRAP